jgi:hypothetical protein
MVDVYTDRDSMFAVPPRAGETEQQRREADRLTQLGRALRELGIGSILAYSPQAKGRIERSFLTAQDRLVKHLRLAKIATLADANQFLETEYWPEWNEYFRKRVRMELGLDGELKARYQGRYLEIQECGVRPIPTETKQTKPPVRKDHNAGGRINWMQGFFDRPSPPLWKCIAD